MGGIVNAQLWICVLYLQTETEKGSEHLLNILSGYLVIPLNYKVSYLPILFVWYGFYAIYIIIPLTCDWVGLNLLHLFWNLQMQPGWIWMQTPKMYLVLSEFVPLGKEM